MKRLTLELSLKPFRSVSVEAVVSVATEIERQWHELISKCDEVALLLWSADGSEILDYRGKFSDEIEWARYIGIANATEVHPADPQKRTANSSARLYTENPATISYGDLRQIVGTLRETLARLTGKVVAVGATFDPGPEFAESTFKYRRHPEISTGSTIGKGSWVSCGAVMHGDTTAYAGFQEGIPEGTSLGKFLGRQSQHFLTDLGFDYIWFSNGFGYALNAWSVKGDIFDGSGFNSQGTQKIRTSILQFWKDFRAECPRFRIETRGSNFSAAMDMSSGACPIQEIYDTVPNLVAPPNSPWAAMDGDYGLEIVGYLSRIAALPPNEQITFRYYINDPWFLNSPWLDRYGREPHDIYLPLALSRLDACGRVSPISNLAFLTIDNSFGELVAQCPREIIPHFYEALNNQPDEPGLITWIYPFSEYHEKTFGDSPDIGTVFFGDWFMRGAINHGFPANSIISTDNFLKAYRANSDTFKRTILLTPVPMPGSKIEELILSIVSRGGKVMLYGSIEASSDRLRSALNLQRTDAVSGQFVIQTKLKPDHVSSSKVADTFFHDPILSAGGIDTVPANLLRDGWQELASVQQGTTRRTYAAISKPSEDGRLAWIRGSFCASVTDEKLPVPHLEKENQHTERLLRLMLAELGVSLRVEKPSADIRDPIFVTSTTRNGLFFSGYQPSTLAKWKFRFPEGAPLLVGYDCWLEGGHAVYQPPRSWHRECRCFVQQASDGPISCVEQHSGEVGIRRRLMIQGLKNATVVFRIESGTDLKTLRIAPNDPWPHAGVNSIPFHTSDDDRLATVSDITGNLLISW